MTHDQPNNHVGQVQVGLDGPFIGQVSGSPLEDLSTSFPPGTERSQRALTATCNSNIQIFPFQTASVYRLHPIFPSVLTNAFPETQCLKKGNESMYFDPIPVSLFLYLLLLPNLSFFQRENPYKDTPTSPFLAKSMLHPQKN